jgi:hypothetical protein
MKKTFVGVHDTIHQMLRRLTRHTPLQPHLGPDKQPLVQYRVRTEDLPPEYFALAAFHGLQGLSQEAALSGRYQVEESKKASLPARIQYFDALKLDRRCARDLRIKLRREGPGLLSADVLAYGVGTLRARNDDEAERLHRSLWRRYGRIQVRNEEVYARIRALHWFTIPSLERARKESFDSTNVLYGDVVGELQQLWDRRADIAFLDFVATSLQTLRVQIQAGAYFFPPLNVPMVLKLHRQKEALWKTPPSNGRALLRRLDYLLDHIELDDKVTTAHSLAEIMPQPEPKVPRSGPAQEPTGWQSDRSGYDGWL